MSEIRFMQREREIMTVSGYALDSAAGQGELEAVKLLTMDNYPTLSVARVS